MKAMKRLLLILALLILPLPAAPEVEWDPNPETDLAGYRLYWGTQPGQHPTMLEVGNVTEAKLNLAPGVWYMVCTAYNTAGLESLPSNELRVEVPPSPPSNLRENRPAQP